MRKAAIYLSVLIACLVSLSLRPPGGEREAYRNYYVGAYYFNEGDTGAATRHFKRAYEAVPDEFNFALAYALSLGRSGSGDEALNVLQRGAAAMTAAPDPENRQRLAFRYMVTGLIYTYTSRFDQAIPQLRQAFEAQKALGRPRLLSIISNTLGYATFMNQGKNAHLSRDQPEHLHIHKRDMERSVDFFAGALEYDGSNAVARGNYKMLCDSLGIPMQEFPETAAHDETSGAGYADIPANIYQLLDFSVYDEVVFLLDISGSMVMEKVACVDKDRFKVMKETALYLLKRIPESTSLGIGTIGGDCGTVPKLWHPVGELNRTDFRFALDFLAPDGTTPLLNILVDSPSLFSANDSLRKAIFLISDGANICKIRGLDICDWADGLTGKNITIQILTFLNADLTNTNAFAEYTCLAENTYGKVFYIDANRCNVKPFAFNLVETCLFKLPEIHKVNCWGSNVDLWAIFKE